MDDSSQTTPEIRRKTEPIGPVAATVLIVLLIALGGIYFFIKQEQRIRTQHNELQANS